MNKRIFVIFSLVCLLTIAMDIWISYAFTSRFFYILNLRRDELYKLYFYEDYLSHLIDAETGQRGFIITGNIEYLEPYNQALKYIDSQSTKDFISNEIKNSDPQFAKKVIQITKLTEDKLRELAQVIALRKNQDFEKAQSAVQSNSGKRVMDHIRYLVESIVQEKQDTATLLDHNVRRMMYDTLLFLILGNFIAAVLFFLSLFAIYKSMQKVESKDQELSFVLQKLNDSLAIREAILNSANYAIISVNQDGLITSFNPAAERILGYDKEELINKHTPVVFHDAQEIEERALTLSKQLKRKILPGFEVFVALAKQGIPDANEWTYIRKDGSRFPVLLSVTAIKNAKDQVIGYLGIAYDITESKEIDRVKNELISITSYELRSPIASVKGALDLLSQKEFSLPEQAKRIVELGQKNCKRLVRLTENIIDIQRLEAGKIEFNFKKLNVAEFLSQVLELNNLAAQQSHVSLVCQTVPSQWTIEADRDRLMQVMTNLVSNAIKYSPEKGEVEIMVKKIDSRVRFEVKDQGPGISKKFQSKIFQKFAREPSPINTEKQGVGLGLSIAKSIIEKHDGSMGFQSSVQGTTFWFELPITNKASG